MSRRIQVIGESGRLYEVDGADVMGDVMGRGRRRRGGGGKRKGLIDLSGARQPGFRQTQLAPGVQAPDEGMLPLPLRPDRNAGVFTDVVNNIVFEGQLQKPFRGERLLVTVVRTGVTATGILDTLMFAGTDLQQVDIQRVDIEQVAAQQAFGVRLAMTPAQPGVRYAFDMVLDAPLTAPDTIRVRLQILGRVIH